MATSKVDACLLCGELPCACGGSTRKSSKRPGRVPNRGDSTDAVPARGPANTETVERPKRVALPTRAPTGTPKPVEPVPVVEQEAQPRARFDPSTVKNIRTEEDQEMRTAVTVFAVAGIIDYDWLDAHRREIDLPQWKIDALIWNQTIRRGRVKDAREA